MKEVLEVIERLDGSYDLSLIVEHWNVEIQPNFTIGDALTHIAKSNLTYDQILLAIQTVFDFIDSLSHMKLYRQMITEGNWRVQVMHGKDPIAYSVGASVRCSAEFFMVGELSDDVRGVLINSVVMAYIEDEDVDNIYSISELNVDGEALRAIVREVSLGEELLELAPLWRNSSYLPELPEKVFQIIIADKNQVLPTEVGYDEDFVQPLF